MILDTEFLIELDNRNRNAIEKAAELESADVPLRVPTIVVQELYVGVGAGSESFENARKYEALVANKPVVEIDGKIARQAGALEGQHVVSDEKPELGPGDAIVAATGLQYNEPVVTNDGDFTRVDGLAVELV
ncbi:Predicted nucleic acid-binding protein, contains PIN domain [Halorientalis persicus]|jgi:predicted nucleic acid-binding protein|uniref:Ribonuclease VapC n=1 Tax=Halorientalis persicus TaxID=1367881 RepID=A0A1H8FCB9_9EURY|nr:PIN domain-containing protein [Halorientalis persicus]SEN29359.1 Predicted nucleic acid-binding protein, contains PIN domain [Halorientalis persicus]